MSEFDPGKLTAWDWTHIRGGLQTRLGFMKRDRNKAMEQRELGHKHGRPERELAAAQFGLRVERTIARIEKLLSVIPSPSVDDLKADRSDPFSQP